MKGDHTLTLTDVTILGNFFETSVTNDFSSILEYNHLDNHCNSNFFKQILYAIHWGYALHLNPDVWLRHVTITFILSVLFKTNSLNDPWTSLRRDSRVQTIYYRYIITCTWMIEITTHCTSYESNSREILQYNTELLNNPGLDRAWLSFGLAGCNWTRLEW